MTVHLIPDYDDRLLLPNVLSQYPSRNWVRTVATMEARGQIFTLYFEYKVKI